MADGLMSQAIANVRLAQKHLVAITGLPSAAAAVQVDLEGTLTTLAPAAQAAASAVLEFAAAAAAPMEAANAAVMAGDAGLVKNALGAVQSAMRSAATTVGTAITGVDTALARLNAGSQTLANVTVDLSAQIAQAGGEAEAAQGEADSLEKNKYYWLLLGPFGLVGLGICIGMLVDATNKVNGIRQHVSGLKAQSAQWTKMQADLDLLRHDIPNLSGTLSSLQNALGFLGGDITEVVADVGNATTHSAVARAFILAAGQQLATLRTDAS